MSNGALIRRFRSVWRAAACAVIVFLFMGVGSSQTQNGPAKAPAQSAGDLVAGLYGLVSAPAGKLPDWNKVRACFLPEAVVVLRTSRTAMTAFSLDGFIKDFVDFYERPFKTPEGAVPPKDKGFTEKVIRMKTWEFGDMAQALVLYEARITGISRPPQQGVDNWLLVRRDGRWLIASVTNELVTADRPVPVELRGKEGGRSGASGWTRTWRQPVSRSSNHRTSSPSNISWSIHRN